MKPSCGHRQKQLQRKRNTMLKELILPYGAISQTQIRGWYQEGIAAAQQLNASVTTDQINGKLTALSATPGGIAILGKELRSPLLREMLYESIIRNMLQVYKLTQGET